MEQLFFLDDSVLCHSSRGDCSSLFFWSSGVLGALCINPPLSLAPFYLYEDHGLQGYTKGGFQKIT